MPIQRSSLQHLVDETRRIIGETSASLSHLSDADIIRLLNRYIQALPTRLAEVLGQTGRDVDGVLRLDMWLTSWNSTTVGADEALVVSSGFSTVHLPTNYDHWMSFYDNAHDRPLEVVEEPSRWAGKIERMRKRKPGVPEAIEIQGYVTSSGRWVRLAVLHPPPDGVPDLTLTGWRLPNRMPGSDPSNEYPDIDPKFEPLVIHGTVVEILAPDDSGYEVYAGLERKDLLQLAAGARAF